MTAASDSVHVMDWSSTSPGFGQWWVPRNPGRILNGSLSLNDQYPELVTLSSFEASESEVEFAVGDVQEAVVLGRGANNLYTLTALEGETTFGQRFTQVQRLRVTGPIIIGSHVAEPAGRIMKRIRFTARGLGHWLGAGPTRLDDNTDDGGQRFARIVDTFPDFPTVEVLPGVRLAAEVEAFERWAHRSDSRTVTFSGDASLRLEYDEPVTFQEATEHARTALDLVTILNDKSAWLEHTEVQIDGDEHWLRAIEPGRPQIPDDDEDPRVRQIVHSVDLNISDTFSSWFRLNQGNSRAGVNVFLASSFKADQYVETDFLNVMTAVDALYRALAARHPKQLPRKRRQDEPLATAVKESRKLLPEHLHRALKSTQHSDLTAGQRLQKLLEWVGPEVFASVIPLRDQQTWISKATKSRNDITHDGTFKKHLDIHGLSAMNAAVRWLLILAILTDLELPTSQISGLRPRRHNEAQYMSKRYLKPFMGNGT